MIAPPSPEVPGVPSPRVAIIGFRPEGNAFFPPKARRDLGERSRTAGEAATRGARSGVTEVPSEIPGLNAGMDATGASEPVPILAIAAPPGGPMESGPFPAVIAEP